MDEVEVVVEYVGRLIGRRFKNSIVCQKDIGIVTPFSEQRQKIHNALKALKYDDIDVGTVELFQGQEKDIIILSTVRSKTFYHDNRHHIGFLSNPKRFNVALTRAKALLIVIGNPTILQTDKHWCYFLKFCRNNKACCGTGFKIFDNTLRNILESKIKSMSSSKPAISNGTTFEFIKIGNFFYDFINKMYISYLL